MDVAHSGVLDGRGELSLRKVGTARYRPIADVDEGRYTGPCERRDYVL
jgi:hypothetical protein